MTSQGRRIAGCHLLLRGNCWMPISVNKAAVRQSPTFWPLTRKFLKLWEYFCDSVAHSLGCAPADRKSGDNLVK
jgi:hypothetical protein